MKPRMLNFICARPIVISWCLGASVLDICVICLMIKQGAGFSVLFQSEVFLPLAVGLVPLALLGYFVGMFTCWPVMRVICSKFNGAPFFCGDAVLILSGPHKGKVAKVYAAPIGQGGITSLLLELGPKDRTKYFEEYSVLRIDNGDFVARES